jgi:hypothetical protein
LRTNDLDITSPFPCHIYHVHFVSGRGQPSGDTIQGIPDTNCLPVQYFVHEHTVAVAFPHIAKLRLTQTLNMLFRVYDC